MRSIITLCAVSAVCAVSSAAQPLSERLLPLVEAAAPAPARPELSRQGNTHAALKSTAANTVDGWCNYKTFRFYQKFGDEWVLAQELSRELDPLTGMPMSEHYQVYYGSYPDDINVQHRLFEYEYDGLGRQVCEHVSVGDTEDSMNLMRRGSWTYFEGTDYTVPESFGYQFSGDNGVTWTALSLQSRVDMERDSEGRITRITEYGRQSDEDASVPVELTQQQEVVIEYGADGKPSKVVNRGWHNEEAAELRWRCYDPADVFSLCGSGLMYTVCEQTERTVRSHSVNRYDADDSGAPERTYRIDVAEDGTLTYDLFTGDAQDPVEGALIKQTYFSPYERNIFTRTLYYADNGYTETLFAGKWLPVVNYSVDSRNLFLLADGTAVVGVNSQADEITYDEATGMPHEYVTPGFTGEGKIDIGSAGSLLEFVDVPSSEWPEIYDFTSEPITGAAQKRVWSDWVKASGAIDAVEADNSAFPVEWYTVDGCRVANPSGGIFIRRQGTQATKVLLK